MASAHRFRDGIGPLHDRAEELESAHRFGEARALYKQVLGIFKTLQLRQDGVDGGKDTTRVGALAGRRCNNKLNRAWLLSSALRIYERTT